MSWLGRLFEGCIVGRLAQLRRWVKAAYSEQGMGLVKEKAGGWRSVLHGIRERSHGQVLAFSRLQRLEVRGCSKRCGVLSGKSAAGLRKSVVRWRTFPERRIDFPDVVPKLKSIRAAGRFFSGVPHPHLLGVCSPNPFFRPLSCETNVSAQKSEK